MDESRQISLPAKIEAILYLKGRPTSSEEIAKLLDKEIADIEKAIMDSNLGLTPSNNGNSVLIPIPALSEERRKDLTKYVHQLIEDGRVAIRNVRRDILHHLKEYGKEEHISEDEIRRQELEIQKITDTHIDSLNTIQENKEKELMEN